MVLLKMSVGHLTFIVTLLAYVVNSMSKNDTFKVVENFFALFYRASMNWF